MTVNVLCVAAILLSVLIAAATAPAGQRRAGAAEVLRCGLTLAFTGLVILTIATGLVIAAALIASA